MKEIGCVDQVSDIHSLASEEDNCDLFGQKNAPKMLQNDDIIFNLKEMRRTSEMETTQPGI